MSLLRFEHYTFDTLSLELCANGTPITLRPKTVELLRELITQRDCVLNKRELIKRIWHTEHVTDQSVFQAISELRAQLAPLSAIRTFPNRGYQWVLPVFEVSAKRRPIALAVAATVLLAAASMLGLNGLQSTGVTQQSGATVVSPVSLMIPALPAMVAFSEGAAELQRGNTGQALELLQLSVTERPEFVEAKLLLAEAWLLHGDALHSRQQAYNVMRSLDSSGNAYATIAAMDLLSRADQQLGQMNSALEWATRAADQANSNGYECTAADLHDRVLTLVQDHDYSSIRMASPVFASPFAQRLLQVAFAERAAANGDERLAQSPVASGTTAERGGPDSIDELLGSAEPDARPAHCERYRGGASGQLAPSGLLEQSLARVSVTKSKAKPLI